VDRLLGMEIFVAAVERGSFAAAARAFQITPPMVGKHIRALEERLGARLLTRTTRRQKLTEIGRQYYERCKQILQDIHSAERGAENMRSAPRGELRICSPVSFGSMRLAPALADYLAQYPQVNVELVLTDEIVDLVEGQYDAAIRIGNLADSSLVARRLEPYRMLICAAPSYLSRAGVPQTPADLQRHACLDYAYWDKGGGWVLGRSGAERTQVPVCRLRSNNGQALRTAALSGAGIVMQPAVLLADDVAAGRLVPILSKYLRPPRPMHLVYLRDRHQTPKMTALIEFLLQRFSAPRDIRTRGRAK
jgi:DNA-binding transcriptional LysR family regulator